MTADEIKKLLEDEKVTQASIADSLGLRPSTVNQVIHGRQTSNRIQMAICEVIKRPFDEVWKNCP